MIKRLFTLTAVLCLTFALAINTAYAASNFDLSNATKGTVKVTCNTGAKMKVIIQKDQTKYTYDMRSDGVSESFPLQLGNGTYKVSLLQNSSGNAYKLLESTSVELNLTDANAVYLNSVQSIDWAVNPKTIEKATELTKATTDPIEKGKILWNYMVGNNQYDFDKLNKLPSTYLPVPDATLKDKKGICYDFASLYASMLRAQGIPAKLVKGYAPNYAEGYHAWNEVYDASKKQWYIVDSTYDLQIYPIDSKKVTMLKTASDFKKVFEY